MPALQQPYYYGNTSTSNYYYANDLVYSSAGSFVGSTYAAPSVQFQLPAPLPVIPAEKSPLDWLDERIEATCALVKLAA